jgi:hypothetical protein
MKRGDIILIAVILIAAIAFIVPKFIGDKDNTTSENKTYAKITVDGKAVKTVELTGETQEIPIDSEFGHNVLKVHNHGIEMKEADCPDDVCFTFGFVTKPGDTIVCLPNRLLVEIVSDSAQGAELDATTN